MLLLLLEKSSGGFVLYLVPWGGFVGGRMSMAAVFAWHGCPVFSLGLVALCSSALLGLHIRCISRRTVLYRSTSHRRKCEAHEYISMSESSLGDVHDLILKPNVLQMSSCSFCRLCHPQHRPSRVLSPGQGALGPVVAQTELYSMASIAVHLENTCRAQYGDTLGLKYSFYLM